MSILIGIQAYPASGGAKERQDRALHALRALDRVELVNLQFAKNWTPIILEGFECLTVLEHDSLTATGVKGIRKPLVGELCSTLAVEAHRRGCEYFCFTNSDIVFTQRAIDEMRDRRRDAYAFSRMEVDADSGADEAINLGGVDAIATRPGWWLKNASRFRQFIVGDALWDQMYASILLRHADAVLFNVHPLVRHVRHPIAWSERGAFAAYNGYLAALDSHYFSLWCEYHAAREEWARRGGSEEEHLAIQRSAFTRPWRPGTRLVQSLRKAKAWGRYQRFLLACRRQTADE
jgi:hypothetical protein